MTGILLAVVGSAGGLAAPVTNTYTSGSGTEIAPTGASNVLIEVWGSGGGGEAGGATCAGRDGDGGGSGGYASASYPVSGGLTLNYVVGDGGVRGTFPNGNGANGTASQVTSGTLSITTLNAPAGGGGDGTGGGAAGATGTGGDTNSPGNQGGDGNINNNGGQAIAGVHDSGGRGGNGGTAGVGGSGAGGAVGKVLFYYT